jgi:hypothetical protein
MICYRDMTFCKHYEDCAKAETCHRPLTPEVKAKADAWWKGMPGEAPIAYWTQKPSCHAPRDAAGRGDGHC